MGAMGHPMADAPCPAASSPFSGFASVPFRCAFACPDCRQTLQEWQRLRERLQALPVPSPDAGMWRRVLHRAMRRRLPRRPALPFGAFWWVAAAACLVSAGLVAWWWQQAMPPSSSPQTAVNLFVSYHADTVALRLGDCPTWHLIASNELMEGE